MRIAAMLVASMLAANAQQVGQNKSPNPADTPTFQTGTQLVVESVVVKDKSGKPVVGLTANDFIVTEDGVPQVIKFFEYQTFPEDVEPMPAPTAAPVIYNKLARTQISAEPPGTTTKYKDHRLLALYFDMTAMPIGDQIRALTAAKKFVRDANDDSGPDGDHDVRRRSRAGAPGFHRGPRPAAEHHRNAGGGRRAGPG